MSASYDFGVEIIGCQFDLAWENPSANYEKACALLAAEKTSSDSLIVLPEMFATGFSMNVEATVEHDNPPASEVFLADLAREKQCAVMGGFAVPSPTPDRGRNELAVFDAEGEKIARYHKNRAFRYTREAEHYEPGEEITVFEFAGWKIAPFICYDLRFPELFRRGTHRGAELITVIASWPEVRDDHWITLLRARAIENLAYVVGINRCGADPNLKYSGRSLIIDPWGKIIADAGSEEGIVRAEIDLQKVRDWRAEFPALADMEVQYLRRLTKQIDE